MRLHSDDESESLLATLQRCVGLGGTAWPDASCWQDGLRGEPGFDSGGDGGRGAERHGSGWWREFKDSVEALNRGTSGAPTGPASPASEQGAVITIACCGIAGPWP